MIFSNDELEGLLRRGFEDSIVEGADLGDYVVGEREGAGATATVFAGTRKSTASPVAIRVIHNHFDPEFLRLWKENARKLSQLEFPGIVTVRDIGEFEGQYFEILDWVSEGSLEQLIRKSEGPLPVSFSCAAMLQVGEAIGVAHNGGVIHGDLKPDNLLVSTRIEVSELGKAELRRGDIRVTDFSPSASDLEVQGTRGYSAPEQFGPNRVKSKSADIYALGSTLYYMLTGRVPKVSESQAHPTPPREFNDAVTRNLSAVCLNALHIDPSQRYESAEAFCSDLRRAMSNQSVSVRRRTPIENVFDLVKQFPGVATTITVLAVVLFGLVFSMRSNEALVNRRESELRSELSRLIPELKGEEREFIVRRLPDPNAQFKLRHDRVWTISRELGLDRSESSADRVMHWTALKSALHPSASREYFEDVQFMIDYALETFDNTVAHDHEMIETALHNLIRSHRILLDLCWKIKLNDLECDVDVISAIEASKNSLDSIRSTYSNKFSAAANRYLDLLLIEIEVQEPLNSASVIVAKCEQYQNEYVASQLLADQCQELHPWYIAWYICEMHYESALALEYAPEDLLPIVEKWREIVLNYPSLLKDENITYFKDSNLVMDRHADVLLQLGEVENAEEIYEQGWLKSRALLTFYKFDSGLWEIAEQHASSLISLVEKKKDVEVLVAAYEQEQRLLRDKLHLANANPGVFTDRVINFAKLDLAVSLRKKASWLNEELRGKSLLEANQLAKELLENAPEDEDVLALVSSLRDMAN